MALSGGLSLAGLRAESGMFGNSRGSFQVPIPTETAQVKPPGPTSASSAELRAKVAGLASVGVPPAPGGTRTLRVQGIYARGSAGVCSDAGGGFGEAGLVSMLAHCVEPKPHRFARDSLVDQDYTTLATRSSTAA